MIRDFGRVLILLTMFVAPAAIAENINALISDLRHYESEKDDLALRIVVKKIAHANPGFGDWIRVRQVLLRRPSAGYGLLYSWDRLLIHGKKSAAISTFEEKVNHWIDNADSLMSAGRFQAAFTSYQAAAKMLKKEMTSGHKENHLLYEYVIHSMARSLYGAGRFEESLRVYGWIDRNYPRYRQVLFEKMWAAFRSGHADVALGTIASQRSTYFSDEMEPESYLVQLYIYKKLCREDEIKTLRLDIERFRNAMQKGTYNYAAWAKSDLELYGLLRLTELPVETTEGSVTMAEKTKEQQLILRMLKTRFESEKKRIGKELDQVLAYSHLAVGSKVLALANSDLDRNHMRSNGMEVWPIDDAEDWLDEIGSHLYLGTSQCAQR